LSSGLLTDLSFLLTAGATTLRSALLTTSQANAIAITQSDRWLGYFRSDAPQIAESARATADDLLATADAPIALFCLGSPDHCPACAVSGSLCAKRRWCRRRSGNRTEQDQQRHRPE
jgi:hypothetical protein